MTPSALMALTVSKMRETEDGSQTQGRLVQHEQPGARHESPSDGAHLLLAAGQRAGELDTTLAQHGEERVHVVQRAGRGGPSVSGMGAEQQVFPYGHEGKEAPPLGDLDDPALNTPMC